jgi:hypothetical protein
LQRKSPRAVASTWYELPLRFFNFCTFSHCTSRPYKNNTVQYINQKNSSDIRRRSWWIFRTTAKRCFQLFDFGPENLLHLFLLLINPEYFYLAPIIFFCYHLKKS